MPVANPNKVKKRKDEIEQRMSSKRLTSGEKNLNTSPAASKKEKLKNSKKGSSDDVDQEQSYVFDHHEDVRSRKHEKEESYLRSRSGDIEEGGGSGDIPPHSTNKPQNKSAKVRKRELEAKHASSLSSSGASRSFDGMENSYDLDELEQSVEKEERSSTSKTLIMEDSGDSIPNGSQASTASNEHSTTGKNKQEKPPMNSRKSHALQMSMSGDIHGEPIQRAPRRSKSAIDSGDLQGMFDQEAPLRSTDARSTDTGARGSRSKGGKPIRRSHTPPRSKSTTESGDFLNSRKPPIDSRKAQVSNRRSGDLQQEDFGRRGPHRTTSASSTGRKPKGGDLHDLHKLEKSVEKKERSSTSKTRRIEDSGHSIPNGSQASTASNEHSTTEKNKQEKPPMNSRKSHALQMSMSGDIHGEPIQRAPHRSKSAIDSRDLQGMFDQEAPLRSTDARSTDTGARGSHSKGGKPIRRSHAPPRSKSTTESGDFLNSRKPPIDSRKAQVSNRRSGDLQQEDFERHGPHRTTSASSTGGKPKGGDLQGMFDQEAPLRSTDADARSTDTGSRGSLSKGGKSIRHAPSRNKSSGESSDFSSSRKPPLDSRKAQVSDRSGDLQQEDFERRGPHRTTSASSRGRKAEGGDLQGMFDQEAPLRSTDARSTDGGGKITVKMRDTDRLLRGRGQGMERQDSSRAGGSGLQRQGSGRPGMARNDSSRSSQAGGRGVSREPSHRDTMSREPSRSRSLSREPSSRGEGLSRGISRNRSMSRDRSVRDEMSRGMARSRSMSRDPSVRDEMSRGMSRSRSMSRDPSARGEISRGMSRSRSMSRDQSVRGEMSRGMSRSRSMSRGNSSRSGLPGDPKQPGSSRSQRFGFGRNASVADRMGKANRLVQVAPRESGGGRRSQIRYNDIARRYLRENLETPPKSLVIIWVVVAAELGMDLVTTIISFMALVQESECCDQKIDLGPIPLSVTIPFFILIITELGFLFRAIKLTLWPPAIEDILKDDNAKKSWLARCLCCCYNWNVKMLFKCINWLVLLNPFFGSVVAWMLLYQSSKNECFTVLGLEAASLVLHFLSVYLEGDQQTLCSILFHCIPVLPFFISIVIILVYLQQGGVCYLVEDALFWYEGCQLCPDEAPPIDGFCRGENGTQIEINPAELTQADYCSPEQNFCFFLYE